MQKDQIKKGKEGEKRPSRENNGERNAQKKKCVDFKSLSSVLIFILVEITATLYAVDVGTILLSTFSFFLPYHITLTYSTRPHWEMTRRNSKRMLMICIMH